MIKSKAPPLLVFALSAVGACHMALVAYQSWWNAPNLDETAHLPSGLSHWRFGNFALYRVNPPLIRMWAAVPLLVENPNEDWSSFADHPFSRAEFQVGNRFQVVNGEQTFRYFRVARLAVIVVSLIGAWVCYCWAAELYGAHAGALAFILWCFCPNMLAWAASITPDMGATAFGVLACWRYWWWLREPDWSNTICAGAALGTAELTKSTWIILFVLWPLLWIGWVLCGGTGKRYRRTIGSGMPSRPRPSLRQMGLVLLLGLLVLNVGYGFEKSGQALKEYTFVSRTLGGEDAHDGGGNRFRESWLGELPVPVPANYLLGIDAQKYDFERGKWSYLRGEQKRGGWWYYYVYAILVKTPAGYLCLAGLAAVLALGTGRYRAQWRDEAVLLLPMLAVLILVSSQTGFNRYLRYALPVYPFLFIFASRTAIAFSRRERWLMATVILLAGGGLASSLSVTPFFHSYFNGAVGGPLGGHRHLLDANIDWGQDLLHLKRWLDAHPEVENLRLAYFGFVDPKVAGIEAEWPPRGSVEGETVGGAAADFGPQPGWFAVSVNFVYGYRHFESDRPYYTYFQRFTPVAMAGYSIYIYCISAEEAKRVRREMGLPVVEDEPVEVSGEY